MENGMCVDSRNLNAAACLTLLLARPWHRLVVLTPFHAFTVHGDNSVISASIFGYVSDKIWPLFVLLCPPHAQVHPVYMYIVHVP